MIAEIIIDEDRLLFNNKNGNHHRIHGPAVIWKSGVIVYVFNGKHHRIGRPAVINNMGNCYKAWYIHGVMSHDDGDIRDVE